MIKTIYKGIIIGAIVATVISPLTVNAETPQEKWIRIQRESNEEFMEGCEKDGNLTEDAEASLSWNKKNNKNKEKVKNNKENNITITESQGKGWVYSNDELHIINLPEGEDGYTQSGWYGNPN